MSRNLFLKNWTLESSGFSVKTNRAYEGLFTQGSGYLHVRGSLEEPLPNDSQANTYLRMPANVTAEKFIEGKSKWGTYIPGLFGNHPTLGREMINLPYSLGIVLKAGYEQLNMETSEVHEFSRMLDLKNALLRRSFRWQTKFGVEILVVFDRFVSQARPGMIFQRVEIISDKDINLNIQGGIDSDVRTSGFDHFKKVNFACVNSQILACDVNTDNDENIQVATEFVADGVEWICKIGERAAEFNSAFLLQAGKKLILEKRSAYSTSRDTADSSATEKLKSSACQTWKSLLHEHCQIWNRWWDACDVTITGNREDQDAIRCAMYHMLRSQSCGDTRIAVDAKGVAGDAYFGRYFWDTEMYLVPFFTYTMPSRAKDLTDFRIQSLEGARQNAKKYGYPGARYAWESDDKGNECCPCWQYADHEVHVTADVVYGIAHLDRAVPEWKYLEKEAAEVVVETAKYWLSRMNTRDGDDFPSLLGVMGPDEYSPISNNNAYTNNMVRFVLELGSRVGLSGGATEKEVELFSRMAEKLPIPRKDDLILQCEDFEKKADPLFEQFWPDRSGCYASAVSQERLYRSKNLKQADVLMMMFLFPNRFAKSQIELAWDYYLPYTTHDSSLSACVHSIIANRLDKCKEAYEFWEKGAFLDLDIEHGGASQGIHIAAAGGVWQMVIMGFAGMKTAFETDFFTLTPRLPETWRCLSFTVVWKGVPLFVEIDRREIKITNRGEKALDVFVGESFKVMPGQCKVIDIQEYR